MNSEFTEFYKMVVEDYVENNFDSDIYNNERIESQLCTFEDRVYDDVVEFVEEQIYNLIIEKLRIKL